MPNQETRTAGGRVAIFICVILLILASLTFARHRITVDPTDDSVYDLRSTWWGFKKEWREIRWMRAPGYDYEAWCARASDGSWNPYITESSDDPSQ